MSGWEVSPILVPLLGDVRREFPGIVIGTIGDPAHQTEQSDHNPDQWGFVCAGDVMFGHGFDADDAERLFRRLIALRDPRMAFVIYNRRIVSATVRPFVVRPYTGSDPHTGHVHVSVKHAQNPRPTTSWDIYPEAAMAHDPLDTTDAQTVATKMGADAQNDPSGYAKGLRRQTVNAVGTTLDAIVTSLAATEATLETLTRDPADMDDPEAHPIVQCLRYVEAHPL